MAEETIFQKIAKAVGNYAPGISAILAATGVGAPVAAAVAAVGALAKSFGLPEDSSAETIATQIMNTADMTEIRLKFIQAENDFQLKQRDQELEIYRVQLADIQNARKRDIDAKDNVNRILAYAIVAAFIVVVGGTLFGFGKVESVLAGTLVGYLSAKCEQVLAYYFGSSKGSDKKTDLLSKADAIK